jgi:hypothetical protein
LCSSGRHSVPGAASPLLVEKIISAAIA